jgi:hypothetical protein
LPLIRIDVRGYAPNEDVRDVVAEVHGALVKAETAVSKMLKRSSEARAEAYGPLASGAASVEPLTAVAGIESATDGTVPELVDIPTLLRLLVLAAERGLAEVPSSQYRRRAPVNSIRYLLFSLNGPTDTESRQVAMRFQSALTGKAFVELCELVLRIANGGIDVPVERAIRAFKSRYRLLDDGAWHLVGQQAT